jgi:hypothetical protein
MDYQLIYFTFRQIFTDMEVIHKSTRKCAEHVSQHNLQKEKKKKERKKQKHKLIIAQ